MRIVRLGVLAFVALVTGSLTVLAQEGTPGSGFDPVARFPMHVVTGTCAEPGEIVFELAEGGYGLATPFDASAESVSSTYVGPHAANPAIVSVTTLDASLTDLVTGGHVIDAHSADGGDEAATRLVCGAVGGFLAGDDLVFGLQEANASGFRGTAWLHDSGGDTTTVTSFLVSPFGSPAGGAVDATGEPEAGAEAESLAPLPPVAETAGLVIEGGAFAAEQLTLLEDVPTVLHLVNSDDRGYVFQIEDLVVAREVPANQLAVIEFTTPSGRTYQAQLHDAETDAVLAAMPVSVSAVPSLAP